MLIKSLKLTITGLLCALGMAAVQAHAHGAGGHHGPAYDETSVVDLGTRYVALLVESKKEIAGEVLDASWNEIPASDKAIDREASWYFVVKMRHAGENKTLYLLISRKGKLYGADFDGKFERFAE